MTKKKAGPRLDGENAKPIVRPNPFVVAIITNGLSETRKQKVHDACKTLIVHEQYSRLCVVASHYGIVPGEPGFWMKLALSLSEEFIPQTRIYDEAPRGPGAPKKEENNLIWSAVKSIKKDDHSTAEACRILTHQEGPWKGKNASTLEQRFYEAERRLEALLKAPQDPLIAHLLAIANGQTPGFEIAEPDDDETASKDYGNPTH